MILVICYNQSVILFNDSYGLYSANISEKEMNYFTCPDLSLNRPIQELNIIQAAFRCSCVGAGVPLVFVLSKETNHGICDSFVIIAVKSVCNGKTRPVWKTPLEKDDDRLLENIAISQRLKIGWV